MPARGPPRGQQRRSQIVHRGLGRHRSRSVGDGGRRDHDSGRSTICGPATERVIERAPTAIERGQGASNAGQDRSLRSAEGPARRPARCRRPTPQSSTASRCNRPNRSASGSTPRAGWRRSRPARKGRRRSCCWIAAETWSATSPRRRTSICGRTSTGWSASMASVGYMPDVQKSHITAQHITVLGDATGPPVGRASASSTLSNCSPCRWIARIGVRAGHLLDPPQRGRIAHRRHHRHGRQADVGRLIPAEPDQPGAGVDAGHRGQRFGQLAPHVRIGIGQLPGQFELQCLETRAPAILPRPAAGGSDRATAGQTSSRSSAAASSPASSSVSLAGVGAGVVMQSWPRPRPTPRRFRRRTSWLGARSGQSGRLVAGQRPLIFFAQAARCAEPRPRAESPVRSGAGFRPAGRPAAAPDSRRIGPIRRAVTRGEAGHAAAASSRWRRETAPARNTWSQA